MKWRTRAGAALLLLVALCAAGSVIMWSLDDDALGNSVARHLPFLGANAGPFTPWMEWVDPQMRDRANMVPPIIYVKTHKTGSSTLQSIFVHLTEKYSLRALLSRNLGFPGTFRVPNSALRHSNCGMYDVFMEHAVYSKHMLKYIPNGHFVTILREPVARFQSAWYYFERDEAAVPDGVPWEPTSAAIADFASSLADEQFRSAVSNASLLFRARYVNGMCHDLGVSAEAFPSAMSLKRRIHDMQTRNFTVLIMEHFDISLALMRRRLNLDFSDVLYIPRNTAGKTQTETYFHRESKIGRFVREGMKCDEQMYQYWNETLWRTVGELDGAFWKEVDMIANANELLATTCNAIKDVKSSKEFASSSTVFGHKIDDKFCHHVRRYPFDAVAERQSRWMRERKSVRACDRYDHR